MKRPCVSAKPFLLVLSALLSFCTTAFAQNHLVVSQIYGGGGNSAATYTNDYVELYNPTSAAISLSGYSLQYASAAGTSWTMETFPTASVQPGHYYLIQLAAGSTAAATLPTPDFVPTTASYLSGTTVASTTPSNLSASAGKIILSNGTTILSGACPTTGIVDLVGYGTANCFEGTGPASNTGYTNATAFSRGNPPTDTDQNATDFSLITANPHNSSNSTAPTTALAISAATASPTSVTAGNQVAFSVTVTPGSTSTGIAVKANLAAIGGSSTQSLALSSTANVYTYTTAVASSVAAGSYSLPVTATDQQSGSASGSISLTVQAPVTSIPISTIQGNRSTYVGTSVTTTGVVTLVTSAGFYIQTPSSTPGSTGVPEGLYIYSGTGKVPASAVVGNNVTVTGSLSLYPAATASHTPSLELASAAATVNSTGQALPKPITITSLTSTGGIYQLTQYESMLATVPSLTATSGTDGNLTETTETITSSGQFYTVLTGTARPFREPGMDFRDFPTSTCPSVTNCTATATAAGVARPANLTLFDDNPERLIVESSLGGGTPLDLSTGAVITNATGVIDFSYSTDVPYGDPARLILQPGSVTTFTPGLAVTALTPPTANQFTVAAFNIERFFNTSSTDDLYFDPVANAVEKSSAVDVTAAAYARRLQKVSLAIRTVLNNPDIISFEESENVSVLKDISAQIDADTVAAGGTAIGYVAYGTDSVSTFTDDVGGISIGFLVKPATVDVLAFQQVGNTSTFTASTGLQTLNDRPSDVLHAGIKRGTGVKDYPVTVISNHLRSLSGIGTSADTRLKKELQAEMLATLIQNGQTAGEHVVAVGDMNAFQFSDGYTDTLGTITGNVGSGVSAQAGKAIVSPAAVDLVTTLPAAQQQSYVEYGNAQVLDHIVVTADIAASTNLVYAHIDSDFPLISYNDATTPARVSDHDPALAYLVLPAPVLTATLTGNAVFGYQLLGTTSNGQVFTLTNTGEGPITFTGITATGDFAQSNNCGTSLAAGSSCNINVVFSPTTTGVRTGVLTVSSNATGVSPVTLTGTAASPTGTLTGTGTFSTAQLVGTSSAAQAFTLTNTSAGPIAIASVAVTGDFSQTNGCGTSLAAGQSCTISVVFKPTAAGTRSGTLTVNSNATGISTVALSGTGIVPDFTITGTNTSLTVAAGSGGTVGLSFASVNGFSGTLSFSCTSSGTAPSGVVCSAPQPVSLAAGGSVTANVILSTTSRVLSSGLAGLPSSLAGRIAYLVAVLLMVVALGSMRSKQTRVRLLCALISLLLTGSALAGCSNSGPAANPTGTPAGTYTYVITATSGTTSHTQTVTLTVQ